MKKIFLIVLTICGLQIAGWTQIKPGTYTGSTNSGVRISMTITFNKDLTYSVSETGWQSDRSSQFTVTNNGKYEINGDKISLTEDYSGYKFLKKDEDTILLLSPDGTETGHDHLLLKRK